MDLRMDRDGVVYVDDPNHHDKYIIFPDLTKKYNVESRRFGLVQTKFDTLLDACLYVRESVKK